MGSNSVKTIVLLMTLVVLSVIIGVQVTDNIKESVGAFVTIGCVVVLFLLLWMGKNSWWLMFLLPPVINNLPIPLLDSSMAVYLTSVGVFTYHYVQCKAMGYARLRWHPCIGADFLILLLFIYMAVSYYRFPVDVGVLDLGLEHIGGQAYVYALGAVLYYFFLSFLDASQQELERVVKWAFWVQLAAMAVSVIVRIKTGQIYWGGKEEVTGSLGDNMGEKRIVVFSAIGFYLISFCYAARPFASLMRSPLHVFTLIASVAGVSLTGARNQLIQICLYVSGIAVLKRELTAFVVLGLFMWGALLGLGSGGAFETYPVTWQRFIAMVPGVHISRSVEVATQGSSEVRLIAWKQAFEPHHGYIKDYIWGDGYQLSKKEFERISVARMRGTAESIGLDNNMLARSGNWHNGFIHTMHRLGLVCCVLFYLVFMVSWFFFFRVGHYYVGKPFFPYFCAFAINGFVFPFVYSYNARTSTDFFAYLVTFSFLKLLYSTLRGNGQMGAFSLRHEYTPMTIRELENKLS